MTYTIDYHEEIYYTAEVEANSYEEAEEKLKWAWKEGSSMMGITIKDYGPSFITVDDIFEEEE